MARFARSMLVASLTAATALLVLSGCSADKQTKIEPKVAPPVIKKAGTLRVGIDLSYPPFGGVDKGKQAGHDLDVAGALAQRLGLTLAVVDVKPAEAATALTSGVVDAVFSVPFSEAGIANVSLAGSYLTDAPAFFVATEGTASVEPSLTVDNLGAGKIGVQEGSSAYWRLASEVGTQGAVIFPTLREAIAAADKGKVKVVAGDAIVGAYIIRDFPKIQFAGQLDSAVPLGVAVTADNTKLGDTIREALDGLAADGVLKAIRQKWVGGLPALTAAPSSDASTTP